jgi:hypothetical protein
MFISGRHVLGRILYRFFLTWLLNRAMPTNGQMSFFPRNRRSLNTFKLSLEDTCGSLSLPILTHTVFNSLSRQFHTSNKRYRLREIDMGETLELESPQ